MDGKSPQEEREGRGEAQRCEPHGLEPYHAHGLSHALCCSGAGVCRASILMRNPDMNNTATLGLCPSRLPQLKQGFGFLSPLPQIAASSYRSAE